MRQVFLASAAAAVLAGCGDPPGRADKPSDVASAAGMIPTESAADQTIEGTAAADTLGAAPPPTRRGLLARLFARGGRARDDAGMQVAALAPDTDAPAGSQRQSRGQYRRGGNRGAALWADDISRDVPHGAVLPFATVGRVCEAKTRRMGSRIERSAAGFDLYDSAPGSTRPRTFYVTGFADGCPRQFTAALALFGAPSMHEQLRYGRPSDDYPYSATDRAYEKVKSAICRVGRRTPCGSRIRTLERSTVFISTYERFTNNGRWADILVHDSAVLAASLKDP